MTLHRTWRLQFGAQWLALCAVVTAGCASWQVPRIDPSGERFLIWPGAAAPATTFGAPAVAPPPGIAPPLSGPVAVPGNVQAPPVWPGAAPGTPNPSGWSLSNPFTPTVVGPPVAPAAPVSPAVSVAPAGTVVPGQDSLRITPDRVLAPVGSEVVLRAGICASTGYLLASQRVEWMLARDGAGQFVELGERGELDLFRWPWDTPHKVDNWYAVGSTASYPVCLRRGNADPSDDVQIQRGEAWVTVTSPAEGTSYVTAYAPLVGDWQRRRATATIYWVDAQWVFPPSAGVESGRPHILTTTVLRQTDGTPVAGWMVRYEVADGGGSLGYDAGRSSEVPTDANGRASVEVSPSGSAGGVTIVNMVLLRPGQSGPSASPPLEIGTGSATITWGAGGASPAPLTVSPPPPLSRPSAPDGGYTPPRDEAPPGQPDLEVRLRNLGSEQVNVGDLTRFEVLVTNRGGGAARNIQVLDRFDRGLSHPESLPNEFAVKYPGMRDLGPGESATVPLTFQVVSAGRHCHEVTVTSQGGEEAVDRACVTAVEAAPVAKPTLEVTKLGPTRHLVGELAKFKIVVKNTGDVPATNVEVVDQYNQALEPKLTEAGREFLPDGRILWRIDRLEAGERREFRVQCQCNAPSRNACNRVIVTADGGVNYAHEACVEILPQVPGGEPSVGGISPSTSTGLRVSIVETANPVRAGQRSTIYVYLENTGQQPERQVELWLMFPAEVAPDAAQIQPQGSFAMVGQEVRFNPIAELRARERQSFVIPVTINRAGTVRIWARLNAAGMTQPTTTQSNAIEILSASQ